MELEAVYQAANVAVLPFWLLLAFAPNARWTHRLVHSGLVAVTLGILYAVLLFGVASPDPSASGTTLAGVMKFFDDPAVTTAGWVHYLVFDLFVASWQVRDAKRRGIRHVYLLPGLFGTLMFGPVGLMWYLGVRLAYVRTLTLNEG